MLCSFKNLDNNKVKLVLPFKIQIVNKDEIIKNPYLNKTDKQINKDKQDLKNVIKENKETRFYKKEGIMDQVIKQKKDNKINKKLKNDGINPKNIIK